jgi:hypothetical protein
MSAFDPKRTLSIYAAGTKDPSGQDDFRWKTIALKGNILHLKTLLQGRRQRPVDLM